MKAKDNLIAAKQLIIANGWGQGEYRNPQGCYCALGAVREVVGSTYLDGLTDPPEVAALVKAVRAQGWKHSGWWGAVIDWNDVRGRTEREVLELFDEAIRIADE